MISKCTDFDALAIYFLKVIFGLCVTLLPKRRKKFQDEKSLFCCSGENFLTLISAQTIVKLYQHKFHFMGF